MEEVRVTRYKANDGHIFDTRKEAEHWEKVIAGERVACPNCQGLGVVDTPDGFDYETCIECKGRRWVEKSSL